LIGNHLEKGVEIHLGCNHLTNIEKLDVYIDLFAKQTVFFPAKESAALRMVIAVCVHAFIPPRKFAFHELPFAPPDKPE
jgi:hypothetical protein